LRQYFMPIPREMDEAAKIDGASRFRVLTSTLVPQSYPVLMAVTAALAGSVNRRRCGCKPGGSPIRREQVH
jgi:ABC-type maltose transport system permease subunit